MKQFTICLGVFAILLLVVFCFVSVPAFLVGMVLSGNTGVPCFRAEITLFVTCKSAAIWS